MECWAVYCEACGALGTFQFTWRGRSERNIRRNIRRRQCPGCGCIALTVVSAEWAAEEAAWQASLSGVLTKPPAKSLDSVDTPLDEWLAGIDALLAEVQR
jgi:hypothetical protein